MSSNEKMYFLINFAFSSILGTEGGGSIFNPDRSVLFPVLGVYLQWMPVVHGFTIGHVQYKLCCLQEIRGKLKQIHLKPYKTTFKMPDSIFYTSSSA